MKFFSPTTRDAQEAEAHYQATRKFVSKSMKGKLSDRRIYLIHGVHKGKNFEAKVGEPFEYPGEPVIFILLDTDRNLYYVCTASRGFLRDMPYLVGGGEARYVEDFE